MSRRTLLRRAVGTSLGLWVLEVTAGMIAFTWPNLSRGLGGVLRIGTFDEVKARNGELPIDEGFPAYEAAAHAFIVLVDPAQQRFVPGADASGDGAAVNVRALYQRCPHLGCRPNPCIEDFWLHCPCHQSRYDRLGIKVAGERYGPAPHGMDRFAVSVDTDGVLSVDTSKITLGPLPVALGQPGVIPPRVVDGCI
jgi:cytochrome b6-f complex iron-sulfur subunit